MFLIEVPLPMPLFLHEFNSNKCCFYCTWERKKKKNLKKTQVATTKIKKKIRIIKISLLYEKY